MPERKTKPAGVLTMSCMVTGNLIGAGILALPVKTGLAGFFPALGGILAIWALMTATALILAKQKSLTQSSADLPTFYGHTLGAAGKWVATCANLLILYGLLVAYASGAASVLHGLAGSALSLHLAMLLFFAPATAVTLFGLRTVAKGNNLLMLLMWGAFIIMVGLCFPQVALDRLKPMDWGFLPATLPVMVTAFHFHNIIPSICREMRHDQLAIRRAILLGAGAGLAMNLLWVLAVAGTLPMAGPDDAVLPGTLIHAFENTLPATLPLQDVLRSGVFTTSAAVFALVAICTSFLANGSALLSFMGDLVGPSRRTLAACLAFLPPLLVALVNPNIFLVAIDLVGGVGIGVLFGILPGILLYRQSKGWLRGVAAGITLCFAFVLLMELGQQFGLLHLHPWVEHWTPGR